MRMRSRISLFVEYDKTGTIKLIHNEILKREEYKRPVTSFYLGRQDRSLNKKMGNKFVKGIKKEINNVQDEGEKFEDPNYIYF